MVRRPPSELPVAAAIKAARIEAGLTQADLAEKAGLPLWCLRHVERGRRALKLLEAAALANALHLSLDDLVNLSANATNTDSAIDDTNKIWLITGASSGFGRALTVAAARAGDTVVACSRRMDALEELAVQAPDRITPLAYDVTDVAAAEDLVHEVLRRHGRLNVLVNNAGRGQVGAVEDTTDAELRDLFQLHFFGPAALTRAVLPHMRRQHSGVIVQMSSFGGQVAYPGFGAYCATKFALEGMSEALAAEVASHGVRVLIIEPGAFRTSFSGGGLHESVISDAYTQTAGATRDIIKNIDGTQPGDPNKAAAAILAAVSDEDAPLRLPPGNDAVDGIREHAQRHPERSRLVGADRAERHLG